MAPARSTVKEQSDKRPKNDAGTTLRRDESANDEVPDKDETEEKLEKLVFGDDAGFLEGLKRISPDQQLTVIRDTSDEEAEDEEHGAIADENVRTSLRRRRRGIGC